MSDGRDALGGETVDSLKDSRIRPMETTNAEPSVFPAMVGRENERVAVTLVHRFDRPAAPISDHLATLTFQQRRDFLLQRLLAIHQYGYCDAPVFNAASAR
jgi:hypothetical protein